METERQEPLAPATDCVAKQRPVMRAWKPVRGLPVSEGQVGHGATRGCGAPIALGKEAKIVVGLAVGYLVRSAVERRRSVKPAAMRRSKAASIGPGTS